MNKVEYETEGVIFNIQRYSLHDGPGIRTIPFKGCPLSCKWCSNPESQRHSPELLFKKNDCIRCGNVLMLAHNRLFPLLMPGLSIATAVFSVGNVLRFAPPVRWK